MVSGGGAATRAGRWGGPPGAALLVAMAVAIGLILFAHHLNGVLPAEAVG